jgi:hypothetical protein
VRAASVVALALAFAACSGRTAPGGDKTPAPAPEKTQAAPPADPAALTFAEGTRELQLRNFCVANHKKVQSCFNDDAYWDVMATLFFAKNPTMSEGNPGRRQAWIGFVKDDVEALRRQNRMAADCEASIRHNRWPSAAAIERVNNARSGACPAFANAFGTMVFLEGGFSEAR